MGWKRVKEHYNIRHIVQFDGEFLHIGSPYISQIISVNKSGEIVKRYSDGKNDDLWRYQSEIESNPSAFRDLLSQEDEFTASIPVYTYDGSEIIEKYCEEPGWPNITHDGSLMYDNTYSTDKSVIVKKAKENAYLGAKMFSKFITDEEDKLTKLRGQLEREQENFEKLNSQYPDIIFEDKE